ncbi:MAG: hypothetical protein ACXWJ6_13390 [Xanthobacteraceae bacterium]
MPRPILNIDDVEFRDWGHNAGWPVGMNAKEHYQARLGDIGRRLGAQKLGYNLTVVPGEFVGPDGKPQNFRFIGRPRNSVDYGDGE